jgi:hypothetical protein
MSFPLPWGAYRAGHPSNTSTIIHDFTGNGRHATVTAGSITNTSGSGNGAAASIPYITGTTSTEILWPAGSYPSTFTICSVTRYTGGTRKRIITSAGNTNNLHGHWGDSTVSHSGAVYYDGWKTSTSSSQSSYTDDWIVTCGTNSTSISTPNNIIIDGIGRGINNGGPGGVQMSINSNQYNEDSDFALNHVLIWDRGLTVPEMRSITTTLQNYLATGSITYPWITDIQSPTYFPVPWGAYIVGHPNNTPTSLYDFTENGRNATIGGTGLENATGSGSGAAASIPYITGTTNTQITWPAGSIPAIFTICSITRYNGSSKGRILNWKNDKKVQPTTI